MRHGKKGNKLSRTASHRNAMMANLGCQLIEHKRITTTLAKAKALRTFIEPIITKTKANETKEVITHNHRIAFSYLRDNSAVKELFTVVGPKIASRPGGYTRIIKLGARVGDNAELAMIELVDFNEIYGKGISAEGEPAKKTRRGRSKKAAGTATSDAAANAATTTTAATSADATEADDLELIEGIGPKTAEVLLAGGITNFEELAAAKPEDLNAMLDASEGNFNAADTSTWPEQAKLAAAGKSEELAELQEKLTGGRLIEDLKIIEGIGPKAEEALNAAGIRNFKQLGAAKASKIKEILDNAENLAHLDPTTWGKQAKLAAKGKMDELKAYQDELNGGKEQA